MAHKPVYKLIFFLGTDLMIHIIAIIDANVVVRMEIHVRILNPVFVLKTED